MTVRSFVLLDLPSLPRYRRDVLPLDSARALTRGNPLGAAALLSYLNPRRHIYPAVSSGNGTSLMGQVIRTSDEPAARLTFLSPTKNANGLTLPLLDHLSAQAGDWGALHLLAEVDERIPAFKSLRRTGFSMYAWQRIWKLAAVARDAAPAWTETADADLTTIQSLHSQIVPALLQPVEPLPRRTPGLICRTEDGVQAYVALTYGPLGIWAQPLIHPDAECVPEQISALLHDLPGRRSRPVYLCVRSYQAWLESVLEDLGAEAGPRQAVMVKHLAKLQKAEERIPAVKPTAVSVQPSGMSQISNKHLTL